MNRSMGRTDGAGDPSSSRRRPSSMTAPRPGGGANTTPAAGASSPESSRTGRREGAPIAPAGRRATSGASWPTTTSAASKPAGMFPSSSARAGCPPAGTPIATTGNGGRGASREDGGTERMCSIGRSCGRAGGRPADRARDVPATGASTPGRNSPFARGYHARGAVGNPKLDSSRAVRQRKPPERRGAARGKTERRPQTSPHSRSRPESTLSLSK